MGAWRAQAVPMQQLIPVFGLPSADRLLDFQSWKAAFEERSSTPGSWTAMKFQPMLQSTEAPAEVELLAGARTLRSRTFPTMVAPIE